MMIVIDTNVIASGLFFGGKPRQLIEYLFFGEVDASVSKEIIEEYHETVEYLIKKYPGRVLSVPLKEIISRCQIIEPQIDVKVCRDPDDNKFISCAIEAKALYIVSGDKDLLDLEKVEGIEIVTVAEFLNKMN